MGQGTKAESSPIIMLDMNTCLWQGNPNQGKRGRNKEFKPMEAGISKQANRIANRKPPSLTGQPHRNQNRKAGAQQDFAEQAQGFGAFWGDIDAYDFNG